MKFFAASAAVALATTGAVHAGGVDRTASTTGLLFAEGTYVELAYSSVGAEVSGILTVAPFPSGDIAPGHAAASFGYRRDITDALSFAFILDEPFGADVAYPAGFFYPFAASFATLESLQMTAALRYEMANNVSVYGGLRAVQLTGDVYVSVAPPAPLVTQFSYSLDAQSNWGLGYMIGAAYERPDIALRVAVTYYSEVALDVSGPEGRVLGAGGLARDTIPTATTHWGMTLPDSLLIEAQSGIAEDTLLFGSLRWTDWSEFAITPTLYPAGNLVEYEDDVWTWMLGIGRRINEDWAVSASVIYEADQGGFEGNLAPTDGRLAIGLGAEYTFVNITVSGGVEYSWIGDAQTENFLVPGTASANFNDNTAIAAGLRIGIQF